jgi:hypothetical protein
MRLPKEAHQLLERLVLENGLRPVVDALADICEEASRGWGGIHLYPDEDDPLELHVLKAIAERLNASLF